MRGFEGMYEREVGSSLVFQLKSLSLSFTPETTLDAGSARSLFLDPIVNVIQSLELVSFVINEGSWVGLVRFSSISIQSRRRV